jgi:hypothetical protein
MTFVPNPQISVYDPPRELCEGRCWRCGCTIENYLFCTSCAIGGISANTPCASWVFMMAFCPQEKLVSLLMHDCKMKELDANNCN